jgi:hypothetical protein
VERHNRTVNLFKEESRSAVQTAMVACPEIIDSSMLVETAAAGIVALIKLSLHLHTSLFNFQLQNIP